MAPAASSHPAYTHARSGSSAGRLGDPPSARASASRLSFARATSPPGLQHVFQRFLDPGGMLALMSHPHASSSFARAHRGAALPAAPASPAQSSPLHSRSSRSPPASRASNASASRSSARACSATAAAAASPARRLASLSARASAPFASALCPRCSCARAQRTCAFR